MMKRIVFCVAIGWMLLSLSGCGQTEERQQQKEISVEKAKEIALEHAGISAEHVNFVKDGLDREDGYLVYDIEFYTNDHKEYDYEIDAYTGEVLSYDYDAEYYTMSVDNASTEQDNNGKNNTNEDIISEAKAKEIALEHVPGATEADIREFRTDQNDGRLEYEVKIYYDQNEYEFEIDGYSGAIRDEDVDSISGM